MGSGLPGGTAGTGPGSALGDGLRFQRCKANSKHVHFQHLSKD